MNTEDSNLIKEFAIQLFVLSRMKNVSISDELLVKSSIEKAKNLIGIMNTELEK